MERRRTKSRLAASFHSLFALPHSEAEVQEVRKLKFILDFQVVKEVYLSMSKVRIYVKFVSLINNI